MYLVLFSQGLTESGMISARGGALTCYLLRFTT